MLYTRLGTCWPSCPVPLRYNACQFRGDVEEVPFIPPGDRCRTGTQIAGIPRRISSIRSKQERHDFETVKIDEQYWSANAIVDGGTVVRRGKFNIFLASAQTEIPLIVHQNTPLQAKTSFFTGKGLRHRTPSPHLTPRPNQAFPIRLACPRIPPARFIPVV